MPGSPPLRPLLRPPHRSPDVARRGRARAAARLAWVGLGLGLSLALAACGGAERADEASADATIETAPDASLRLTQGRRYRVGLRPREAPAPVGPVHEWVLTVEHTGGGGAATPERITIEGGMPDEGEGFETEPRVTPTAEPGVYRVEGVRFHRAGAWALRVAIVGQRGADVAVFRFDVGR